jgi:hypothetical protein
MSAASREAFLSGLDAFRNAVDEPTVRATNGTGDFLRRGLTVAAYNLLETFIADRFGELAAHINSGQTQFPDLPERLQRRAITQVLEVAKNKMRHVQGDVQDLMDFAASVGQSLSAVDRSLQLSPFTWLWPGSNMAAEDYSSALRFFHVAEPWLAARELAARLAFPVQDFQGSPIDLKQDLADLASERHRCAHEASYGVTTLWIRALPTRILRTGLVLDILASIGASLIRQGNASYLGDDKWLTAGRVRLRFVRQRARDYGEYTEASSRAKAIKADGRTLFRDACSRNISLEAVVFQDASGQILDWSIPAVN